MSSRNDGSEIREIVFIGGTEPARTEHQKSVKQWLCPNDRCARKIGADTLRNFSTGWAMQDQGRWWVKGQCPHCFAWIQITKSGIAVSLIKSQKGKPPFTGTRTKIVRRPQ
jgi:hypothetical protein